MDAMIVSVAFPIAVPGLYDYRVPEPFRPHIVPGLPVKVELRKTIVWGVVIDIKKASPHAHLKDVRAVKQEHWTDSSRTLLRLYRWIADYYHCEIGKVFRPLVRRRIITMPEKKVAVFSFSGVLPAGLSDARRRAAEAIRTAAQPLTSSELRDHFGLSDYMIAALSAEGILTRSYRRIMRTAEELYRPLMDADYSLTPEQARAVEEIGRCLGRKSEPFLIHGITGSGKTYVYIELTKMALKQGLAVIILVPEISLTPQTIQRFRSCLGDVISVIHSRMSDGERRDGIEAIVSEKKRVIIGVRSAILAPVERLGLIIVDEEHDMSYKQDDFDPRYHARNVAVMRGYFQNALVLLGSATPSFESYYNALHHKYRLITLEKRFGRARLPAVKIIDMNEEHRQNNWSIVSRYLARRIRETLDAERQIIFLLNRRGFSVSLICKECGYRYTCPQCTVNLIYHRPEAMLRCHQCDYAEPAPRICTRCGGEQIRYKGTAIQKAEEYLCGAFADARVMRMDQDATRRKGAHGAILQRFERREADILIGTQMVAKGLNFPGVSLVGVLQSDIGLHFPDFRASERTFQLIAQVAGRAGREDDLGEVVIQTYVPDEPCIQSSRNHDFHSFYEQEIGCRRSCGYPPFSRCARIVLEGKSEEMVLKRIASIAGAIRTAAPAKVTVLGPAPAVLAKINNAYRYSLLLKARTVDSLQKALAPVVGVRSPLPAAMKLIVDVDPVNML